MLKVHSCGISQIFCNVYATRPVRTIKPFSEMLLKNAWWKTFNVWANFHHKNRLSHHPSSPGDDCVELAIWNFYHGHQFISSTSQVEGEAHTSLEDLQSEELRLVSGLVIVVVHKQRIALQGSELDIYVVIVGIQRRKLHVGELLKAIAVQFAVFAENPWGQKQTERGLREEANEWFTMLLW